MSAPGGAGLPSVGVIIPNDSRVLELSEALSSIMQQTYGGRITVYLVYRPRPEVTSLLGNLDPAIRAIPFEHGDEIGGIAARRNVGLDASDDDLIALLDDDDLWHPEKLSRQVETLRLDPNAVGAATGFVKFRSPGPPTWPPVKPSGTKTMSDYEIARSGAIATTSMIFRGSIARELRFDERPGWLGVDDYHFRLRVSEIGHVRRLKEVLTAMRTDDSSASRRRQALQYARALDVLATWMKQGHRRGPFQAAFFAKCLVTSLTPPATEDAEAVAVLHRALDGDVFGRVDRRIAACIERGWRSRRVVPGLRKILWSNGMQRLRGIRISGTTTNK